MIPGPKTCEKVDEAIPSHGPFSSSSGVFACDTQSSATDGICHRNYGIRPFVHAAFKDKEIWPQESGVLHIDSLM